MQELELFAGWDKPDVALFVTGQQKGYIEPCGCAGLTNQKGGLARRHTLVRQLKAKGWPLVALDVGNQVRRFGRQAELKFQITVEGLKTIGYDAITFGENDLGLSVGEVAAATMTMDDQGSPFQSANAAVLDRSLTPRFHVLEAGGKKIGVTSVLGTAEREKVTGTEIVLQPAVESLEEVVPQLKEANCDLYVLLAHASLDESRQFARRFPDFDVIVSSGGLGDPTYEPEAIAGSEAILVQVGVKGMFAGVIGVFPDSDQPLRYQRVPLDVSYADSPEMLALLKSYQDQLKITGLDGLGVKPIPHASGNKFVGSQACADCHTQAFAVWEETPHAHATDSLVHPGERSQIERHFDPECLSCHVTGWNAQNYFPYQSGYLGLEETPALVGNGCENCHGPGSAHVAAELGDVDATDDMLMTLRHAMRLPLNKAEDKCRECHDLDNDPEFQKDGAFDKYWPKVEHTGLD
ncbi:MAG: multiheme c-type cytochrome [Pirellulaceae bacterium]